VARKLPHDTVSELVLMLATARGENLKPGLVRDAAGLLKQPGFADPSATLKGDRPPGSTARERSLAVGTESTRISSASARRWLS
jgi:hypothetical protein